MLVTIFVVVAAAAVGVVLYTMSKSGNKSAAPVTAAAAAPAVAGNLGLLDRHRYIPAAARPAPARLPAQGTPEIGPARHICR